MYNSFQIANYFIKASQNTGGELTPMKLIKMCYIAHGWHLGLYDKQLLDETIYAWKFGPVVNSIYHEFKKYGSGQVDELYSQNNKYPLPDESIKPFLDTIWNAYGKYTGLQLSAMTHQPGTPWYKVWHDKHGDQEKFAIIPNEIIKEHYKQKILRANEQPNQPAGQ